MQSAWSSPPRLAVLGPVRIWDGATSREPSGRRGRALLIALASPAVNGSPGTISESGLIDEVWGDDPPAGARQALQTLVSRTRAATVPGLLARRGAGYALALARDDIDVGRAALLLRQAADMHGSARWKDALDLLDAALALWRGEPGADAAGTPAGDALQHLAATLRDGILSAKADALLHSGDAEQAARLLEPLVSANPLDETRVAALMRALATAGRRTDALAIFASTRALLRDELGVSPGPQLVAANTALLSDRAGSTSPRSIAGVPAAPNSLIGRDADVAAVNALLARARLVTILGTGGLGKTRLSLEVARRSPDGARAVFVELAGVRAPEDVPLAFASALGLRDVAASRRLGDARADDRSRILGALRERPTLLVVDNCEHVIDAASGWVADLLAEVADLRVIATTRTPLEIAGEHVFALEPLSARIVDGQVPPAVELFLQRAEAARPGVHLPADVVGRLCGRLDGLPLAIELAAARVRTMSVEQIEARLEHRFALLTGGDRDAPDRHRTLRAVVQWSWDLLGEDARDAFCALAVFPDGFSAEAAQEVLGSALDALDVLDALVTQSLVTARDMPETGRVRFRMLETMREFGIEALTDAGTLVHARRRVIAWADAESRRLLPVWSGPGQVAAIHTARAENENLVFAFRAAVADGDAAASAGIFALVACLLSVSDGHLELAALIPEVTRVTADWDPDADHALAAVVGMLVAAVTAGFVNEPRVAVRSRARLVRWERLELPLPPAITAALRVVTSVRQVEDVPLRLAELAASPDPATALVGALVGGQIAENRGDMENARAAVLQAWRLARDRGDVWVAAMSAGSLAIMDMQAGVPDEALKWVEESAAGMTLLGIGTAYSDWIRSFILISMDRREEARVTLARVRSAPQSLADGGEFIGIAELGFAELARLDGDIAESRRRYREALAAVQGDASIPSPWVLMTLAWGMAATASDAILDAAELEADYETLLAITADLATPRSGLLDLPVLGVAALGVAASDIARNRTGHRVPRLLALAELLGARADLPALRIQSMVARAEAAGWDVEEARAGIAGLTRDEAAAQAIALIAEPPPVA